MLAVYLFCLVVGGGFALLSAFGDLFDADADLDLDADLDVDIDAGVAADAADTGAADTGAAGPEVGHAAAIFSLRSLVYTLFGFGATGTLLTALGAGPGAPVTVGFAVLAGLLVGGSVGALLAWLKRSGTAARGEDREYVGRRGRVTLPIGEETPGRILVERGGRQNAVRALPFPQGHADDPGSWKDVVVLEMRDGVAYVDAAEGEEPLLESGD